MWRYYMKKIYQLKITTEEISPPIWRTILLPESATFAQLHAVIMDAFKFEDYHLFEFIPDKKMTTRIGPVDEDNYFGDFGEDIIDATTVTLADYSDNLVKMYYVYDFGDFWQFKIELQKILESVDGANYPMCIKGKGGQMFEDIGGTYAYETIANWCRDQSEKNRQALIDLYGSDEILAEYKNYDPDFFDINDLEFRVKF